MPNANMQGLPPEMQARINDIIAQAQANASAAPAAPAAQAQLAPVAAPARPLLPLLSRLRLWITSMPCGKTLLNRSHLLLLRLPTP